MALANQSNIARTYTYSGKLLNKFLHIQAKLEVGHTRCDLLLLDVFLEALAQQDLAAVLAH